MTDINKFISNPISDYGVLEQAIDAFMQNKLVTDRFVLAFAIQIANILVTDKFIA
jgi:hypothetical protein